MRPDKAEYAFKEVRHAAQGDDENATDRRGHHHADFGRGDAGLGSAGAALVRWKRQSHR
jgi:hypothetical protein